MQKAKLKELANEIEYLKRNLNRAIDILNEIDGVLDNPTYSYTFQINISKKLMQRFKPLPELIKRSLITIKAYFNEYPSSINSISDIQRGIERYKP